MALSERPVAAVTRMSLEQLNAKGGLLGRNVEIVEADGQSSGAVFARQARRLIESERVDVIFGCWTSASRRAVLPVIEQAKSLLVYPVQYEGIERSDRAIYLGAVPNQQILPSVAWCFANLGRKFFLVGSDYVFPRSAHEIIKDQLRAIGAEFVGESFVPLGSRDVSSMMAAIRDASPDVILNSINGDTNLAFFRALRATGERRIPTMSYSIAEPELRALGDVQLEGEYAAWNYFQSLDGPSNRAWLQRVLGRSVDTAVLSDPMQAAWVGTHLWAQAVSSVESSDPTDVRAGMLGQSIAAPEGVITIDRETGNAWKIARIGRVRRDRQFDVVWSSERPVRPEPYPAYRSPEAWERYLRDLYNGWGQRWQAPG